MFFKPRMIEDYINYAIVFYYGNMKFYSNATLQYKEHFINLMNIEGSIPLFLGGDPNKSDRYFRGSIKYVAIFP